MCGRDGGHGVRDGGRDGDVADFDLALCQAVSRQAGDNMDEGIDWGSVAAVLHSHAGLEHLEEGFNDEAFAQQHLCPAGASDGFS